MSAVRMCDKCGTIFSESAQGWSTYTGTRITRDENGRQKNTTQVMDMCPMCSAGETVLEPRLAIAGAVETSGPTGPEGQ